MALFPKGHEVQQIHYQSASLHNNLSEFPLPVRDKMEDRTDLDNDKELL